MKNYITSIVLVLLSQSLQAKGQTEQGHVVGRVGLLRALGNERVRLVRATVDARHATAVTDSAFRTLTSGNGGSALAVTKQDIQSALLQAARTYRRRRGY